MQLPRSPLPLIALAALLGVSACDRDAGDARGASPGLSTAAGASRPADIPTGQLPADVTPTAYRLELAIDPRSERFSGKAVIELRLDGSKDHFYLHGKGLAVKNVSIGVGETTIAANYEQVDPSGIARISTEQSIEGELRVEIDYDAPFNQALEGLYKVSESSMDYAFTQFEPISARLAFPGFDEPRFKTPYDITLVVPESMTAIGNTPEHASEITGGLKTVHFRRTKPLPTYLLAFAVGDFDVVEWQDLPPNEVRDRPLPLRGIAARGKGKQLEYALAGTNAIVSALEDYFGSPYPWAKLDILAVPDFSYGAMENVGAITYRESLLLFDQHVSPLRQRRYKTVHAHELAHQWFGDLVTPAWWNDIWLNESFATWMAHVAMDMAEPGSKYRRDLLGRGLGVMASDSLVNARQIRQPILSNDDIATAFDGITYSKGGAVLSMFEEFLGRQDFRTGVRNYLAEFEYGNATADDFVRHLAAASGSQPQEIVIEAFNSFLGQPGLPLIEVDTRCDEEGAFVHIEQSRYFPSGSGGDREAEWTIPMCLRHRADFTSSRTCLVLTEKEAQFKLPSGCPDWVLANANGAGYYRFGMDREGWTALLDNSHHLNTNEMMAMIGSLAGAFDSGQLDVATLMSLSPGLIASPDWQVATSPMEHMRFMRERIAEEGQKKVLEERFADYFVDRLNDTGLAATADREKSQLQAALVDFMAITARQPQLRAELAGMAAAYSGFGGDGQLHPEAANPVIIGTALAVAVNDIGEAFVDHLQRLALASTDTMVRSRALEAIGNTHDRALAKRVRELVLSDDLRDNEIYSVLFPQLFNEETREEAWPWLRRNLERVLERMPQDRWGYITTTGSAFCDAGKRVEVEDFFGPRIGELTGGPRLLAQTLEKIDLCVAKVAQHKAGLDAWLGQ